MTSTVIVGVFAYIVYGACTGQAQPRQPGQGGGGGWGGDGYDDGESIPMSYSIPILDSVQKPLECKEGFPFQNCF